MNCNIYGRRMGVIRIFVAASTSSIVVVVFDLTSVVSSCVVNRVSGKSIFSLQYKLFCLLLNIKQVVQTLIGYGVLYIFTGLWCF